MTVGSVPLAAEETGHMVCDDNDNDNNDNVMTAMFVRSSEHLRQGSKVDLILI